MSKYPPIDRSRFPSGPGSVWISEPASPNESGIRRAAHQKDELISEPAPGVNTVSEFLDYIARVHGEKPCMGWREVVDVIEEKKEVTKTIDGKVVKETKKWDYFKLGGYQYVSYTEVRERAHNIAKALLELGVEKGDTWNIYATTSPTWQWMQYACSIISVTVATAYDTLGEAGLTHSLNETECIGLFTNAELLPIVAAVLPRTPSIRYIVYDGKAPQAVLDNVYASANSCNQGTRIFTIDELLAFGKGKPEIPPDRKPKSTYTACIMYTAGTTGNPKGVVLRHSTVCASVAGALSLLGSLMSSEEDSFLAFLPSAHILEYIVEMVLQFAGVRIGYGRIKTLTDMSVRECLGDLREFKPTIMIGVPAIWETIRKGIITKVNRMGSWKKSMFGIGMSVKRAKVPILAKIMDNVVFAAVRDQTGGRLRYVLSGGAAISVETQEFLSLALVKVLQGYGLTETCGTVCVLPPEFLSFGPAGLPVPSVEIKLLDVPDAGYKAQGNPPQGEILVRGHSVTTGYYNRPDLNNDPEIFTEDGWFRTGDVGQFNEDGTVSIIDRVKNLVKLQGGEYIALERLDTIYRTSSLVANGCVYATSESKQPIMIAFPHEQHLRNAIKIATYAGNLALPPADVEFHRLCKNKAVRELVLKDLVAVAKRNRLRSIEVVQAVVLGPDEWTTGSGLVTAAQKVQRKNVEKAFKDQIMAAYKAIENQTS
ncbi:acetyl-CoA synthetase-like protein [Serendipita vermifera]|nr:acetyl-CoA synthetase-like protein [Serendipita vermifera]